MPFDWSRVLESAVLLAPTAVVSGYAGARLKAHIDRAKTRVSVVGCHLAEGPELEPFKVAIDDDLTRRLEHSPWFPTLRGSVDASKVANGIQAGQKAILDSKSALLFLERVIPEVTAVADATTDDKVAFLRQVFLGSHAHIIDAAMTGALARKELIVHLPPEEELTRRPLVAPYHERTEDTGGFRVHLRMSSYQLFYRSRHENDDLLPAAKAIAFFEPAALCAILANVREQMIRLTAEGDAIVMDLKARVTVGQHVMIELSVANRGKSPALFTQWGVLQILPSGTTEIPLIEMERTRVAQPLTKLLEAGGGKVLDKHEGGFSLSGGSTLDLLYRSIEPLSALEGRIPQRVRLFSGRREG